MKWIILATAIILLLPFYSYVMSRSITLGKLKSFKQFKQLMEETHGEEKE